MHLHPLELFKCRELSDTAINRLIKKSGNRLYELLLLFWADVTASGKMDDDEAKIMSFINMVLTKADKLRMQSTKTQVRELKGEIEQNLNSQ